MPISIILPIPCGLFVPSLSIGAGIGRFFGEAARYLLEGSALLFEGSPIVPGVYGAVGAAAFTGSVTHTLSTAIVVFEITGTNVPLIPTLVQISLRVVFPFFFFFLTPICLEKICLLVALTTARKFSVYGIYDSIARIKGLPILPDLKRE